MTKRNDKHIREARREDAAKRQAAHDKLTPAQKLTKLSKRPGSSSREIVRLNVDVDDYKGS